MSLNIGTLVGYLQLDDANFARKADNADRKINALKLHLEALGRENPKIGVEVTAQTAQLDLLKAKLADLKVQAESGVDVRVDAVQALIELDRVQTKIRELHGKTVKVDVDVDKSKLASATSGIGSLGDKLGVLPALAVAGTSALIPLMGVLGGLSLALGAPLLLAAGGATLFGFLASLAAKDTEKQLKSIAKLREHLGTLTKGTAEYAAAQKQLRDAEKSLTPEQKKFADAQETLTGAFQKFLAGKGGQSLLDVMAQGMGVLSHLLPVATPLIVAVGNGLSTLLGQIDRAGQGQGFEHFIGQMSHLIGPDIVAGGHILMNLASGLGSLLLVLAHSHLSHEVVSGLVDLTNNFEKWSHSSAARHDVRDLFEYVHKVGPQVGSTLGAIARGAGHFVKALAPLGPPTLKVVEGIANAISAIPVPVLTALAAAFVAITAAAKVGKALSFLSNVGTLGSLTSKGGVASLVGGGVQKVFVVNMGGSGGLGGGPGGLGKNLLGLGLGATVVAAAAAAGFAKGRAETLAFQQKYGGKPGDDPVQSLVGFAQRQGAEGFQHDFGNKKFTIDLSPEAKARLAQVQQLLSSGVTRGALLNTVGNAGLHDGKLDPSALLLKYGLTPQQARGLVGTDELKSTTDHLDTLRAHAALASREIDLIGPNTKQAAGTGIQAIDALQQHLNAVHDKKIAVILQDQAAIQSLEALQNLRLHDKFLTVFERSRMLDQAVGPGGGMGQHHAGGGEIRGAGSGVSDSVRVLGSNGEYVIRAAQYAANRPLVQAINNGSGRISLTSAAHARGMSARQVASGRVAMTITNWADGTGYIEDIASDVHEADHRYATAVRRSP